MSDYDKRYNVHGDMVSFYTNDPAEALRHYNMGLAKYASGECRYPPFINEGYGEWDFSGEYDMVTRRTTNKVLPSTLEFLIARAEVQNMLKELR